MHWLEIKQVNLKKGICKVWNNVLLYFFSTDLVSRRKVEIEEAKSYAEENGILHFETSAKTADNVKKLFVAIAEKLPKNNPQQERDAFPVLQETGSNKKKSGCC